jgi:uncharacterized membrane protein
MKLLSILREFALNFIFVFVVYIVVTYLYNQIAHGTTVLDWENIIKYSVIFSIIFTFIKLFGSKSKKKRD